MESIVCKNCLPEGKYTEEQIKKMRGYWDIDYSNSIAKCANCGFERPFVQRKPKVTGKPNPSQQAAIDRIAHMFKDWRTEYDDNYNPIGGAYKHETLHKFEIKPTDYGTFWVYVQDVENILIQTGGSFHIGKRGAITLYSISNFGGNAEHKKIIARYYALAVGANIAK